MLNFIIYCLELRFLLLKADLNNGIVRKGSEETKIIGINILMHFIWNFPIEINNAKNRFCSL